MPVINIADELSAQDRRERREQEQQNRRDIQEATMRSRGVVDPFLSFTAEDFAVYNGPKPPYSIANIEADSQYEDLICPLLCDLPPIDKMVMWQDHIYHKEYLKTYRQSISPTGERLVFQTRAMKNPMADWTASPNC
jgi:hypothetical protein